MTKNKEYMTKYKSEYYKNNIQINFTLPISDYTIVKKIIDKEGKKISTFARESLLAQTKNIFLFPKEIIEEQKQKTRILRGVANNINQIAKHSNEQGFTTQELVNSLLNYVKKLESIINKGE